MINNNNPNQFGIADLSGEQRKAVAITADIVAAMTDRHNADPCATIPLRASMWDGEHELGYQWRSKIGIPRVGGVYVMAYADGAVYVGSTMNKKGGICERFARRGNTKCHVQLLVDHGCAGVLFVWTINQLGGIHPQEAERLAIAELKISDVSELLNEKIPFPAGLPDAEWRGYGAGVIDTDGIELTNGVLQHVAVAARKFEQGKPLLANNTYDLRRATRGLTLLPQRFHADVAFYATSLARFNEIDEAMEGLPIVVIDFRNLKRKPQHGG